MQISGCFPLTVVNLDVVNFNLQYIGVINIFYIFLTYLPKIKCIETFQLSKYRQNNRSTFYMLS